MKTFITILLFFVTNNFNYAQNDSISRNGFYIPKNTLECNLQLDKMFTPRAKKQLLQLKENKLKRVSGVKVFGEWFQDDSTRLVNFFNQHSITDWEERGYLVILSYYRFLKKIPFDIAKETKILNTRRDSIELEKKIKYGKDIVADSINGIYIPKDIFDCFSRLDEILDDSTKNIIKAAKTKKELVVEFHMDLGRWMRNAWRLWGGSRLKEYFKKLNLKHPDQISSVILYSYNQFLNGIKVEIEKYIADSNAEEEAFKKAMLLDKSEMYFPKVEYSKEYKMFLKTKKIKKIYTR